MPVRRRRQASSALTKPELQIPFCAQTGPRPATARCRGWPCQTGNRHRQSRWVPAVPGIAHNRHCHRCVRQLNSPITPTFIPLQLHREPPAGGSARSAPVRCTLSGGGVCGGLCGITIPHCRELDRSASLQCRASFWAGQGEPPTWDHAIAQPGMHRERVRRPEAVA